MVCLSTITSRQHLYTQHLYTIHYKKILVLLFFQVLGSIKFNIWSWEDSGYHWAQNFILVWSKRSLDKRCKQAVLRADVLFHLINTKSTCTSIQMALGTSMLLHALGFYWKTSKKKLSAISQVGGKKIMSNAENKRFIEADKTTVMNSWNWGALLG